MINDQEARNPPRRPTRSERTLARIMTTFGCVEGNGTDRTLADTDGETGDVDPALSGFERLLDEHGSVEAAVDALVERDRS